jgi:hypothetical protein
MRFRPPHKLRPPPGIHHEAEAPLYGDLEFILQATQNSEAVRVREAAPPAGDSKFCSAALGFVFQCCSDKNLSLHPCCAALKMETILKDGRILKLCKEAK